MLSLKDIQRLQRDIDDSAWWQSIKQSVMLTIRPLFASLFASGATLGQHVRPRPELVLKAKKEPEREIITVNSLAVLFSEFPEFVVEFERLDTLASDFIQKYTDDWWEQFSDAARRRMKRIILQVQEQGLDTEDAIKLARQYFNEGLAKRIAVSEVTNLMGGGAQAAYNAAGFPMWEWQTVQDAFVDPICVGLHGQRFSMNVMFQKAHIGCRCWPVPVGDPLPLFGARPNPVGNSSGTFTV